ncbi:DUF1656 domain-containing protein [Zavarzinia compransoris]|uniref:DUF1656 domain-containing protein n=1 Tax=Zavarzinia compransoris TaxID=1264899 RepID=A0A317DWF2_9PROT|nr:DUF1656 domain-containing protein [Zavarzinia compransoris]PWR18861.1 DUF1656 domain-containing protein [Zavarzinia compransoris]TDP48856.1 uncharacterized protein DUF1656 [Zavarzinia compransoris]
MMLLKELSLAGVYLSPLLLYAAIAAGLWWLLRAGLAAAGAYRLIWHPPLFNTALYLMVLAGVAALLHR